MNIRRGKRGRQFQLIDVTPMADIVFLLLIFFMLSSTFVTQPGIKITLPRTQSAEIQPEEKIILTIARDARLYINNRRVEMRHLIEALRESFAGRTDRLLIVKADERVEHGVVVEALDKAKLAGADRLAIASDRIQSTHEGGGR